MLLWGLFALLYCTVIPGLAVLAISPVGATAMATVPMALGLSLVINHLVAGSLLLTGWYLPSVTLPLVLCVSIATACLIIHRLRRSPAGLEVKLKAEAATASPPSLYTQLAIGLLLAVGAYHFQRAVFDFGNVFSIWDAVVSWNRWAVDWSQGIFPRGTYDYPQLLPSIWSLIYQLIGTTDIQVFAKATVAWLPVAAILVYAGIWQEERTSASVVGAIAFTLLLRQFKEIAIGGYVEFPTAILAFIGYFAGWLATRRDGREAHWLAIVGAAIAAGAGVCKQGGLYYAFFYPLFFFLLAPDRRQARAIALQALILILAIIGFSYGLRIIAGPPRPPGQYGSIASTLMFGSIHGQATALQKAMKGLTQLSIWLTPRLLVPLVILWLFAFRNRLGRILLLGVVLPPLVIYVLFFGYDVRNAWFCAPFIAWAAGIGFHEMATTWLKPHADQLMAGRAARNFWSLSMRPRGFAFGRAVMLCAAVAVVIATAAILRARGLPTEAFFRDNDIRMRVGMGYKHLNAELLPLVAKEKVHGKIVTNYSILEYIPGMENLYAGVSDPNTFKGLEQDIEKAQGEYVLDIMASHGTTAAEVSRLLAEGKLTLVREFTRLERLYRVTGYRVKP